MNDASMLLSLYASFRWAGTYHYVLKMGVLVILLSLFSSFIVWYVLSPIFPVLLALHFLSFPFYALWEESRIILPPPYEYSQRLTGFEIHFLTNVIFSLVPQGPVVRLIGGVEGEVNVVGYRVIFLTMEVGSIPSGIIYPLTVLFLFFMLVNIVGALLGYIIWRIYRMHKIGKFRWESIGFFGRVALGIAILIMGIWFLTFGEVVRTSPVDAYYYDYNPYPYLFDGFAFVVFSIIWLIINVAEYVENNF